MNGTWTTQTVEHNEKINIRQGDAPIRIYFEVLSGAATLSLETSADNFGSDVEVVTAGVASGSRVSVNATPSKTLLGNKVRCVLSDPSAEVKIQLSTYS